MVEAPTPDTPPIEAPLLVAKPLDDKSVKDLARELKMILRDNRTRRAV